MTASGLAKGATRRIHCRMRLYIALGFLALAIVGLAVSRAPQCASDSGTVRAGQMVGACR